MASDHFESDTIGTAELRGRAVTAVTALGSRGAANINIHPDSLVRTNYN